MSLAVPYGCSCRCEESALDDKLYVPRFDSIRAGAPPQAAPTKDRVLAVHQPCTHGMAAGRVGCGLYRPASKLLPGFASIAPMPLRRYAGIYGSRRLPAFAFSHSMAGSRYA